MPDGRLSAAFRLSEDRRYFRTGVGGRDNDLRQIGAVGDRLAEPGGGSAAKGDDTVGAALVDRFHRLCRDLDWRMHHGPGKNACGKWPEPLRQCFRVCPLLRC
ncbi:hypothetical protein D9M72_644820 [compost metagenome]